MADTRFFRRSGPFLLGRIAQHVGANLSRPALAELSMHDVATLESAGVNDISLFSDGARRLAAAGSRAGAIITTRKLGALMSDGICFLYVTDPRLAFALAINLFYPAPALETGVHATSLVDPSAVIGDGSQIDPGVIISRDVTIGQESHIEAHAFIGEGVSIGDSCIVGAKAVFRPRSSWSTASRLKHSPMRLS